MCIIPQGDGFKVPDLTKPNLYTALETLGLSQCHSKDRWEDLVPAGPTESSCRLLSLYCVPSAESWHSSSPRVREQGCWLPACLDTQSVTFSSFLERSLSVHQGDWQSSFTESWKHGPSRVPFHPFFLVKHAFGSFFSDTSYIGSYFCRMVSRDIEFPFLDQDEF